MCSVYSLEGAVLCFEIYIFILFLRFAILELFNSKEGFGLLTADLDWEKDGLYCFD